MDRKAILKYMKEIRLERKNSKKTVMDGGPQVEHRDTSASISITLSVSLSFPIMITSASSTKDHGYLHS